MRILSMDVGDRRIGLAVSDPLGWTAQGLETLQRRSLDADLLYIHELVLKYAPEKIVIGLPKNMNNSIGPQGEKVLEFGEVLKQQLEPEIVFWDERLSSVAAHRVMIAGDVRRDKRKQRVDQLAAVIILQNYLDFIQNKKEE